VVIHCILYIYNPIRNKTIIFNELKIKMGVIMSFMLYELELYEGNIFSLDEEYFICVKQGLTQLYFYADDLKIGHDLLKNLKEKGGRVTIFYYNKIIYAIKTSDEYYQSNQIYY